eukprot:Gb_30812 [translate_table: standard]
MWLVQTAQIVQMDCIDEHFGRMDAQYCCIDYTDAWTIRFRMLNNAGRFPKSAWNCRIMLDSCWNFSISCWIFSIDFWNKNLSANELLPCVQIILLTSMNQYSTMLAENLVDLPSSRDGRPPLSLQSIPAAHVNDVSVLQNNTDMPAAEGCHRHEKYTASGTSSEPPSQNCFADEVAPSKVQHGGNHLCNDETEDDFSLGSADYEEDDEATLEADEAVITEDERREELAALKDEIDLPLEEILKRYKIDGGSEANSIEDEIQEIGPGFQQDVAQTQEVKSECTSLAVESIEAGTSSKDVNIRQLPTLDMEGTIQGILDEHQEKKGSSACLGDNMMDKRRNLDSSDAVLDEPRAFSEQRMDAVEEKDGNLTVSLLIDLTEASDTRLVSSEGNGRASVPETGGGQDIKHLKRGESKDRALSRRQRRSIKEAVVRPESDNETGYAVSCLNPVLRPTATTVQRKNHTMMGSTALRLLQGKKRYCPFPDPCNLDFVFGAEQIFSGMPCPLLSFRILKLIEFLVLELDDEATLSEEEEMAKAEGNDTAREVSKML